MLCRGSPVHRTSNGKGAVVSANLVRILAEQDGGRIELMHLVKLREASVAVW